VKLLLNPAGNQPPDKQQYLLKRVAHLLRIEFADRAPEFIPLGIEEDKSWRKCEVIKRCELAAHGFLDIDADNMNGNTNADLFIQFLFERVNDGLYLGAGYSEGGLKFEQNGGAGTDHVFHDLCVVHERGLARMQDDPGRQQARKNNPKCKVLVPARLVGQQDQAGNREKAQRDKNKGILTKEDCHELLIRLMVNGVGVLCCCF